jgi:uncharacterized protein YwgA
MDTQDLRLATVYRIACELPGVGKTKLQKLTYFLQETVGVPLAYPFKMHHYGPYVEPLETDLARLRLAGYVRVDADPNGYGFHITATAEDPDEDWRESVLPYGDAISRVIKQLGGWPTYQLELAATIHFVKRLSPYASPEEVIDKTKALKPKFDEGFVLDVYDGLVQLGMVKPR